MIYEHDRERDFIQMATKEDLLTVFLILLTHTLLWDSKENFSIILKEAQTCQVAMKMGKRFREVTEIQENVNI